MPEIIDENLGEYKGVSYGIYVPQRFIPRLLIGSKTKAKGNSQFLRNQAVVGNVGVITFRQDNIWMERKYDCLRISVIEIFEEYRNQGYFQKGMSLLEEYAAKVQFEAICVSAVVNNNLEAMLEKRNYTFSKETELYIKPFKAV